MHTAVAQYRKLDIASKVETASPHELIKMLFDGAKEQLRVAQGCISRSDIQGRSAALSATVSILEGLQGSLDHDQGGELSGNLDALYSYMMRRLWQANMDNDQAPVQEVRHLLGTVSEAWATLGDEVIATSARA